MADPPDSDSDRDPVLREPVDRDCILPTHRAAATRGRATCESAASHRGATGHPACGTAGCATCRATCRASGCAASRASGCAARRTTCRASGCAARGSAGCAACGSASRASRGSAGCATSRATSRATRDPTGAAAAIRAAGAPSGDRAPDDATASWRAAVLLLLPAAAMWRA